LVARVETIPEPDGLADDVLLRKMEAARGSARQLIAMMPEMPKEANALIDSIKRPGELADVLISHLGASVKDKQKVLETIPLAQRLDLVLELTNQERKNRG
jgi:ATP-dependent Lon protease